MLRWLALLLLCLLSVAAMAEVPVPPLEKRVTDLTGTLSADQKNLLESQLSAFEAKKGSQIAVLIVPSTKPEAIEQYSIRVVEQWKLGRKGVDDGVLLLVAKDDRKVRIEVGYGLEGALNDATSKRIIEDFILPHFRTGNFFGGIGNGVDHVIAVVDGEPLKAPDPSWRQQQAGQQAPSDDVIFKLFTIAFVSAFSGMVLHAMLGASQGSLINLTSVGTYTYFHLGSFVLAAAMGVLAFVLARITPNGRSSTGGFSDFPDTDRSYRGGSGGGGFSSGGGFSGGGGSFGGGGASGSW